MNEPKKVTTTRRKAVDTLLDFYGTPENTVGHDGIRCFYLNEDQPKAACAIGVLLKVLGGHTPESLRSCGVSSTTSGESALERGEIALVYEEAPGRELVASLSASFVNTLQSMHDSVAQGLQNASPDVSRRMLHRILFRNSFLLEHGSKMQLDDLTRGLSSALPGILDATTELLEN